MIPGTYLVQDTTWYLGAVHTTGLGYAGGLIILAARSILATSFSHVSSVSYRHCIRKYKDHVDYIFITKCTLYLRTNRYDT